MTTLWLLLVTVAVATAYPDQEGQYYYPEAGIDGYLPRAPRDDDPYVYEQPPPVPEVQEPVEEQGAPLALPALVYLMPPVAPSQSAAPVRGPSKVYNKVGEVMKEERHRRQPEDDISPPIVPALVLFLRPREAEEVAAGRSRRSPGVGNAGSGSFSSSSSESSSYSSDAPIYFGGNGGSFSSSSSKSSSSSNGGGGGGSGSGSSSSSQSSSGSKSGSGGGGNIGYDGNYGGGNLGGAGGYGGGYGGENAGYGAGNYGGNAGGYGGNTGGYGGNTGGYGGNNAGYGGNNAGYGGNTGGGFGYGAGQGAGGSYGGQGNYGGAGGYGDHGEGNLLNRFGSIDEPGPASVGASGTSTGKGVHASSSSSIDSTGKVTYSVNAGKF